MDWDKLKVFYAVAKAGSLTHASDTLNLSQSAISRQISSLEDSLRTALFHRHARGLLLTEQGEILFATVKDVFAKLTMIESKITDSKQLAEGPLIITVAHFLGSLWLSPKIKKFLDQYPGVQLSILLEDRVLNLGLREADIAIRLLEPEQPDLIQKHLTKIPFHLCASKEYLENAGAIKDVKDLKNHRLIGFPENIVAPFADPNWLLRIAGIDQECDFNLILVNSIYGMYQLACAGAGIACLPRFMVEAGSNLEILLPDVKRPDIDMYFVYPQERRHSQRIDIFRNFLIENLDL